jgi:hypothetical protein
MSLFKFTNKNSLDKNLENNGIVFSKDRDMIVLSENEVKNVIVQNPDFLHFLLDNCVRPLLISYLILKYGNVNLLQPIVQKIKNDCSILFPSLCSRHDDNVEAVDVIYQCIKETIKHYDIKSSIMNAISVDNINILRYLINIRILSDGNLFEAQQIAHQNDSIECLDYLFEIFPYNNKFHDYLVNYYQHTICEERKVYKLILRLGRKGLIPDYDHHPDNQWIDVLLKKFKDKYLV